MCVTCATTVLKKVADAGAGALGKPTEVLGAISLVTLAGSVLWMLDPRNALHKLKGGQPDVNGFSRTRHAAQALWHLLLFILPLRR